MNCTITKEGWTCVSVEGRYFSGFQFDPTKLDSRSKYPTWSLDPLEAMIFDSVRDSMNFMTAHQTEPPSLRLLPIKRTTMIEIEEAKE